MFSPTPVVRAPFDPTYLSAAAFLIGLAAAVLSSSRASISRREMYQVGLCAIAGGWWGAHLAVVLFYTVDPVPWAWLQVWRGAKSSMGGFFGGTLAAILYLKMRRTAILPVADALAPALALSYTVGRLGCFFNGDDFGRLTALPWAVSFPPGTLAFDYHVSHGWIAADASAALPVHPWQLYMVLVGVALFALVLNGAGWPLGMRMGVLCSGYGCARLLLEPLRADYAPFFGPLSFPQVGSVILLVVGIALVWRAARRSRVDETAAARLRPTLAELA